MSNCTRVAGVRWDDWNTQQSFIRQTPGQSDVESDVLVTMLSWAECKVVSGKLRDPETCDTELWLVYCVARDWMLSCDWSVSEAVEDSFYTADTTLERENVRLYVVDSMFQWSVILVRCRYKWLSVDIALNFDDLTKSILKIHILYQTSFHYFINW